MSLATVDATFDAVVCVFGIFFLADMPAALRILWRLVKPGGALAVTTWGPRFLEPGSAGFWRSVAQVRPELHKGFHPWDKIQSPQALQALQALQGLFDEVGIPECRAHAEAAWHPTPDSQAWWSAAMGSGYRGTLEQMTHEERGRVRELTLQDFDRQGTAQMEANVVYAMARKAAAAAAG